MRKIIREKQVVLVLVAAVLVSMCAGAVMAKRLPSQAGVYEQLKVFTEALSYVESNYVEEVESTKVIHGAIRGMLRTLDPHSSFMPPEVYREMQVETEGRFGGLGIEITMRCVNRGVTYRRYPCIPSRYSAWGPDSESRWRIDQRDVSR